jgi:polysaccharide export outer membrane protein
MKKILLVFAVTFLLSFNLTNAADEYIIGTDDVLDIVVWKEESLSKAYTVDKDGLVTMPFLKEVKVGGLTTIAASELIANRLKAEGYLVNPVVTVTVKEYHSQKIMVFGTVKKPGSYYLKEKTNALDLLSQIDYTESGSGKMVILRRDSSGEETTVEVDLRALVLNGDLSQNIEIKGGDKVIFSRISTGQQVYVLGEVNNPGPYTIERDMSVLEAFRMAGGFTDFANKGKAKIIREEGGKKKVIAVNLNKISKGDKSQDVMLKAGDVLLAVKSWF